mgnify:CR=1 FL=1
MASERDPMATDPDRLFRRLVEAAPDAMVVVDQAGGIVHNLRTAVIAPDGRIRTILSGGDWTPEQLVAELTAALEP